MKATPICLLLLCGGVNALRASNVTTGNLLAQSEGILCRDESDEHDFDVEVQLLANGTRALRFSHRISKKGRIVGRKYSGDQTKVKCTPRPYMQLSETCLPARTAVPNCSSVPHSCLCVADSMDLPEMPDQRRIINEAMVLCKTAQKKGVDFNVLALGLGGGAVQMYLRQHCDAAKVESVELDHRVTMLAGSMFGFKPDSRNRVEMADAFEALRRRISAQPHGVHYDLVLADCYDKQGHVPSACSSDAFIVSMRTVLKPGGRILQSVAGDGSQDVLQRYKSLFGDFAVHVSPIRSDFFVLGASVPEGTGSKRK